MVCEDPFYQDSYDDSIHLKGLRHLFCSCGVAEDQWQQLSLDPSKTNSNSNNEHATIRAKQACFSPLL